MLLSDVFGIVDVCAWYTGHFLCGKLNSHYMTWLSPCDLTKKNDVTITGTGSVHL